MLIAGQIIRYGRALYRVEYVNDCRAKVVPLAKRHVELPDGREFDADRSGVNISPNSIVEVIEDLDRAKDEIALEEVEEELAAAKAELAKRSVTTVTPPERPSKSVPRPVSAPRTRIQGGGWHRAPAAAPAFKDGTLAAQVWAWIGEHPGQSTAEIVDGVKVKGAVAACVSRFHQAGLIEKR